MNLFGLPLFGVILPYFGFVRLYLNADGSHVDTGLMDAHDERGPLYVEPLVFEWLGFGIPIPFKYRVRPSA